MSKTIFTSVHFLQVKDILFSFTTLNTTIPYILKTNYKVSNSKIFIPAKLQKSEFQLKILSLPFRINERQHKSI